MPKLFPAESEWQAPWEKNGTEFNEDVAKHLIYNLSKSEHNLEADLSASQRELNAAKREVEAANAKLTTESKELLADAAYGRKVKVAIKKGMDPAKAKWLSGDTAEEIAASADEYLKDHGAAPAGEGGEGEGSGQQGKEGAQGEQNPEGAEGSFADFMVRQQPVSALVTGASNGTDGERNKGKRPAETVEDAASYFSA